MKNMRPPVEKLETITRALSITVDELLGVKPLKNNPAHLKTLTFNVSFKSSKSSIKTIRK
jgi:hypothetical protein